MACLLSKVKTRIKLCSWDGCFTLEARKQTRLLRHIIRALRVQMANLQLFCRLRTRQNYCTKLTPCTGFSRLDRPVWTNLQMEHDGNGLAGDHRPRGGDQAEQQGDESAQSPIVLQARQHGATLHDIW